MDSFLSIGIVGISITFAVEWLKRKYGDENARMFTILLSVLFGAIIFFVTPLPIWKTVLGCLAGASVMYSYIIKVSEG